MNAILNLMPEKWRPYAKFVISLVGAALTLATITFGAVPLWVTYLLSVGTAVGVWGIPNKEVPAPE